ncbi:uncharacterized protein LOC135954380 isoform X3 [Calliphora vicina]|uniref:uncharacterized protein LOC135954380 isoform X3 n=1 Tax=Calliphora vicina TaxID=7373 RepID=UPI00325AEE51
MKLFQLIVAVGCIVAGVMGAPYNVINGNGNRRNHQYNAGSGYNIIKGNGNRRNQQINSGYGDPGYNIINGNGNRRNHQTNLNYGLSSDCS